MRFDDRLSTVLGLSAEAPRDKAVQWRQLVELVARGAGASDPQLLQRAFERIAALTGEVPDAVRAAAAQAIAGPGLPAALITHFVDRTEIATPLLTTVELDDDDWADVRSSASPEVRAFMDSIRPPEGQAPQAPEGSPAPVPLTRFRDQDQESPKLFLWECGPTGEIDWVEGAPRAALIGRSVADDFQQRFAARLPFSDEPLVVAEEGALAGEWKWSGTPAFFPDTGRFAGYHGSARRGDPAEALGEPRPSEGLLESNRLRELIHELRTPLTAIIGFGEIIEGQILGPAHRTYRDRAAEIVRQARRLLSAVDDFDLAAKLQSARAKRGPGTAIGDLLASAETGLRDELDAKGIRLVKSARGFDAQVLLERGLAERLLHRFVGAIITAAGEREELALTVERAGEKVGIALTRPRALRGISEDHLLDPASGLEGQASLGIGFELRLARGLAAIAGGGLVATPNEIVLTLPAA